MTKEIHAVGSLPCVFLPDVRCAFRKTQQSSVMEECFSCAYFKRFNAEMQKADDDFWEFEAKIRRQGGYLPEDLR